MDIDGLRAENLWVSEYDYPNRRVTLTRSADTAVGHHWTPVELDLERSDSAGDFTVTRRSVKEPGP